MAQAATGGESTTNPGIVALSAPDGEHRCSAVLVAPEWALIWSDTLSGCPSDTLSEVKRKLLRMGDLL